MLKEKELLFVASSDVKSTYASCQNISWSSVGQVIGLNGDLENSEIAIKVNVLYMYLYNNIEI